MGQWVSTKVEFAIGELLLLIDQRRGIGSARHLLFKKFVET